MPWDQLLQRHERLQDRGLFLQGPELVQGPGMEQGRDA